MRSASMSMMPTRSTLRTVRMMPPDNMVALSPLGRSVLVWSKGRDERGTNEITRGGPGGDGGPGGGPGIGLAAPGTGTVGSGVPGGGKPGGGGDAGALGASGNDGGGCRATVVIIPGLLRND